MTKKKTVKKKRSGERNLAWLYEVKPMTAKAVDKAEPEELAYLVNTCLAQVKKGRELKTDHKDLAKNHDKLTKHCAKLKSHELENESLKEDVKCANEKLKQAVGAREEIEDELNDATMQLAMSVAKAAMRDKKARDSYAELERALIAIMKRAKAPGSDSRFSPDIIEGIAERGIVQDAKSRHSI